MVRMWNIVFLLAVIGSVFISFSSFIEPKILPKWLALYIVVGVAGLFLPIQWMREDVKAKFSIRQCSIILVLAGVVETVVGLLQFAKEYPDVMGNVVTGTFDNVAGYVSCLCIALPFAIYLCSEIDKRLRLLGRIAVTVMALGVLLSCSRAGWVTLLVLAFLYLIIVYRPKNRWRRTLCIVLLTLSSVAILSWGYIQKQDSADGRWLIWKNGIEMFKDAPLFGHGYNAVEKEYMDYQTAYLQQHADSKDAYVADNVKHLFCEPLEIAVRYGLLGCLLLSALIYTILRLYFQQKTREKTTALFSLVALAVFSLFSYPTTYPFTWLMIATDIVILLGEEKRKALEQRCKNYRHIVTLTLTIISLGLLLAVVNRYRAETRWAKAYTHAVAGKDMLSEYESLYTVKGCDPYFLYNYAAELHLRGQYQRSIAVAQECTNYWADYDLELLLGLNHIELGEYVQAEQHLMQAHNMCPSRFEPLYQLVQVKQKQDLQQEARKLALQILRKKVKVPSADVEDIKSEMKFILNNNYILTN